MQTILTFLEDLDKNNNREWFQSNRHRYEESREKMLLFTSVLIQEIRKIDPEIPLTDPRECMFRIFRDVRFSPDKRPYKTHFGSFIAAGGGKKSIRAGYYFHLQPGGSFLGGGIWCPEADVLKAIRTEIYDNTDEFKAIVNNREFKKYFPEIQGEQLKKAPKGFDPDFSDINLLRYKSYTFGKAVTDGEIFDEHFVPGIVRAFRVLYPANRFLNAALDKWL